MTREEFWKIVEAVIDAHKDNEMGGKYAKAFNHGVQSAFNRVCKALDDIKKQQQPCKNCKYFEYDTVAKVDGMQLIVAHEICKRWGDGCKTQEDGYCFLFEPQAESEDKE